MSTIPLQQHMTQNSRLPFSLPAWIALAPFEEYLGMEIREACDGRALLIMPFRVLHCQGAGLMHGGAVTSLADTALAIAIKTLLPEGTHFATIEMKLTFHSPVQWGTVSAHARVLERKDRDISGKVDIITEDGVKAASFQAVFRVKRAV
ncbi:PaaI family thioesterase [Geobacter sp. SVR]|uniref:PaaI family thioesterase n=1 Tax=Geobacter sp. SVR TaxID=2495594 RepID=UPI00143EF681|nr:PaaI family thioesterase [Geobacter sp. SVR]BCS53280.1 acyl-CoA thioesterase [Geobacter sp. SVR]GCF85594.1 acyl-CoA thioesterase [Geobacter sp. SVR]